MGPDFDRRRRSRPSNSPAPAASAARRARLTPQRKNLLTSPAYRTRQGIATGFYVLMPARAGPPVGRSPKMRNSTSRRTATAVRLSRNVLATALLVALSAQAQDQTAAPKTEKK